MALARGRNNPTSDDNSAADKLAKAEESLSAVGLKPEAILDLEDDVILCLQPDHSAADTALKADTRLNPGLLRQYKEDVRLLLADRGANDPARSDTQNLAVEVRPNDEKRLRGKGGTLTVAELKSRWAGVSDSEAKEVLAAVRKRAEDWRTGTAGVLGVITAAFVVSGTKDAARLFDSGIARGLLAALLVLSAGLGLASLGYAIRAANGPAWLDTKIKESVTTPRPTAMRDLIRARAAAKDLVLAQRLLWCAIGVLVLLVACFWTVPHGWEPHG